MPSGGLSGCRVVCPPGVHNSRAHWPVDGLYARQGYITRQADCPVDGLYAPHGYVSRHPGAGAGLSGPARCIWPGRQRRSLGPCHLAGPRAPASRPVPSGRTARPLSLGTRHPATGRPARGPTPPAGAPSSAPGAHAGDPRPPVEPPPRPRQAPTPTPTRHAPSAKRPRPQRRPPPPVVGEGGFEPPASCSQSRCATRLRYSPGG